MPHHQLYLTALFGQFNFEKTPLVHSKQGHTHAWVKQLNNDLDLLSDLETADELHKRIGGEPM
eukprot:11301850-Heterocapsa_arctica.AAC.1